LKLERLLAVALLAAPLALFGAGFDAPTGLTIQAKEGGRFQLLWDPIYRDDLSGYSVWLRRPGEREFTRLSIPVKVGKEIRKLPVTGEARLILALGATKRDVEVTVVAEYEDGSSERSPSAFTARAAQPPAPAPGPDAAKPASSTAQAEGAAKPTPTPEETPDRGIPVDQPWQHAIPQADRPLLTPFKGIRSEVGVDFDYIRSIRQGQALFGQLGLIGTGIDPNKQVSWERVDLRTIFSVPLTLRWGFMPGFEAWAQASYHAEDVSLKSYVIDGSNYDYIRPVAYVDGNWVYLSDPTSAGLADSKAGVRIQLFEKTPLIVGAEASIPTGISRFKSFLDWNEGRQFPAGTGEGVMRMRFGADFGYKGLRPGLSFEGAYSPGVTERLRHSFFGNDYDHVLTKGDRVELGGAYTFPWTLRAKDGSLVVGALFSSTGASRWTINGVDVVQAVYPDAWEQSRLVAHINTRFVRDDAMELYLQAFQDLPGGLRTGGRVSYLSQVQGDAIRLSGQFYY
jgi:hypothetical protein